MLSLNQVILCVLTSTHTLVAQQSTPLPDLLPDFTIKVAGTVFKDLPEDQIKKDMELILRRNNIGISEHDVQILQITLKTAVSEDKRQGAAELKLDLLIVGFTLGTAMSCSEKPSKDECWQKAARRIGYWDKTRLLIYSPNWQSEIRQNIKDLTEEFALFYLRKVQGSKDQDSVHP